MKTNFQFSIAKDPQMQSANEDFYSISPYNNFIALSDGASESFDSKTWAKLLVENICPPENGDINWLEHINNCINISIDKYKSKYADLSSLSWAMQAAFERGSYATLLGVYHNIEKSILELLSIGDSICSVFINNEFHFSYGYNKSDEFSQHPFLISTLSQHNEIDENIINTNIKKYHIPDNSKINLLCMTDALGQWLLKKIEDNDQSWQQLFAISSDDEFNNFILKERENKKMRVDDTTLICVEIDNFLG